MGSAFHDITLGADVTGFDPHATAERIRLAAHDDLFDVRIVEGDDGRIANVRADLGGQPRCRELREALVRAWGKPSVDTVWLGTSHRRASYEEEELKHHWIVCRLLFDRYVDTAEWVAALPLDLSSPFPTLVLEQTDEHSLLSRASGPGLGATSGATDYSATIVNGKVVEITVNVRNVSRVDGDEVRTKLVERLETRPEVDKTAHGMVLSWKRPVPVALQHADDGSITIVIGTPQSRSPPPISMIR